MYNIIEELSEFMPRVNLIHSTPIHVAIMAIRQCYDSFENSDSLFEDKLKLTDIIDKNLYDKKITNLDDKDKELIKKIIKSGHESTLEHIVFNFRFEGFSRLMLQELVRHRIASYSIKSSRYTLKELKDEDFRGVSADGFTYVKYEKILKYILPPLPFLCKEQNDVYDFGKLYDYLDNMATQLKKISNMINKGYSNDIVKYYLPESFRTSGVISFNARSLRNFLKLRMSKRAHFEIRYLAEEIFDILMNNEYRVIFQDLTKE